MTAPLFVKGGVPVPFKQRHEEEDGTLELHVSMPHTPVATDCEALGAADDEVSWSGIYDDDGVTTRYKTHGEHWRARAGFGAKPCAAGAGGRLSLHFEVSHSSYAVAHERVHWVVRNLPDAVADVSCAWNGSGGNGETSDVAWSHSAGDRELRVTAPLGHSCVVGI